MDKNAIRIGTPCDLDWKKMTAADRGRFCAECKKVVRDLSSMTKREANEMLGDAKPGQLCVRYLYDANGKILFAQDKLLPASLLTRSKLALAAAAIAIPLATTACAELGMGGGGESMGDMTGYAPNASPDDAGSSDTSPDAKPQPRQIDSDATAFDDAESPTIPQGRRLK